MLGQPGFGAIQHLERLVGFEFAVGEHGVFIPLLVDALTQRGLSRFLLAASHRGARIGDDDLRVLGQRLRNVSFHAARSSPRSRLLPAAFKRSRWICATVSSAIGGSDATSAAQSRLQRLQLLPVARLPIDARQQQQPARVLFSARFQLFERRERRLQLLVLEMHFRLHDQYRRAPIARNFQRAGQPFVAPLRRALQIGCTRGCQVMRDRIFRFTSIARQRRLGGFPIRLPTAPSALARGCGERVRWRRCFLSASPELSRVQAGSPAARRSTAQPAAARKSLPTSRSNARRSATPT